MSRLMAKSFDIPATVKDDVVHTGLQSKFNAFTAGKNITAVHDFSLHSVAASGDEPARTKALLLFEQGEGAGAKEDRIYAKVIEGREIGTSDLQTAVNSWSKGKSGIVAAAATVDANGKALVVILHTKVPGEQNEADEPAAAEPVAA